MQKMLLLCLYLFICFYSLAQNDKLRPLTIGDTLPQVAFEKIFEQGSSRVHPEDLKGKLTIIDFWNVGCKACIKSMPKMDSLQRLFGKKIQIILVTYNTEQQVRDLFNRVKIKRPDLPMVIEDSNYYKKLFPHEGDPLHIWIDSNRVVKSITSGYNATTGNINKMLAGTRPKMDDRNTNKRFDYRKGLLEGFKDSVIRKADFYSVFFRDLRKDVSGMSMNLYKDSVFGKPFGIKVINVPMKQLYVYAYSKELNGFDDTYLYVNQNNRIFVETAHPMDLRLPADDSLYDEWMARNLVSYEMRQPLNSYVSVETAVQKDLERYTPFTARFEKRIVKCWVLHRTSNADKLKTKSPKVEAYSRLKGSLYVVQNSPLKESLVKLLTNAYRMKPHPILDETGYSGSVDMQLNFELHNIEMLKGELQKYDLTIELLPRTITVLVIRDKKHSSH